MSNAIIWSGYYNQLSSKEVSIVDIIRYLSKNDNTILLEISTENMKDTFPVHKLITLIYDENFLNGQNVNEKITMLQKVFEILFGYSKNLLIKFDIYRDKYIKVNTFQIVTYLSKLPNYSNYLSLIGYEFFANNEEWRFSDEFLTNERRAILQYLTVCCALGYDYWNDCLKYLFLTIFTDQRLSMEKLINEQNCEFCEFELDKSKYRCTVCLTEINKMSFYGKWKSQPFLTQKRYFSLNPIKENSQNERKNVSLPSPRSNENICSHSTNDFCNRCGSDYKLNNKNKNSIVTNSSSWTCECTCVNDMNQINCSFCYSERKNQNLDEKTLINKSNFIELPTDFNSDEIIEMVKNGEYMMELQLESNDNEIEWKCNYCTTINKINSTNCSSCFQENPNIKDNIPHLNLTNNDRIENEEINQNKNNQPEMDDNENELLIKKPDEIIKPDLILNAPDRDFFENAFLLVMKYYIRFL